MPQVYLRKEAYDRIIESGHRQDLEAFLVHAVDLAIEEVRQIPKSSEPPASLSFTSIPAPAPTVTSDTTTKSQKKRKVTKPKPARDPTFTMKGTFLKKLQCDRCLEQFSNRDEFDLHLPCPE
jgi:hypothetical protein